jgi:uncharacterized membrane protein YbhN (UPF0104 family)
MRNALRIALGLAISAVSGWLLLRQVDVQSTLDALRRADPLLVALAVGCLLLSLAAKTARWQVLLPRSPDLSFTQLFGILQISMLINNVLPLRAGDITRGAMTMRRSGVHAAHVVSSMVSERAVDAAVLFASFLVVSPFIAQGTSNGQVRVAAIGLAVLLAAGLIVTVVLRRMGHRSEEPPRGWRMTVAAFAESWHQLASPSKGWPVWAWSAAAWVSAFAINGLLFRALSMGISPLMAVVVTCTTNLAMLVPSSPGYVGVYHAAVTLTLLAYGVDGSLAASFAVLSHLVNILPVSLIGAGFLLARLVTRSKRQPAAGPAA